MGTFSPAPHFHLHNIQMHCHSGLGRETFLDFPRLSQESITLLFLSQRVALLFQELFARPTLEAEVL